MCVRMYVCMHACGFKWSPFKGICVCVCMCVSIYVCVCMCMHMWYMCIVCFWMNCQEVCMYSVLEAQVVISHDFHGRRSCILTNVGWCCLLVLCEQARSIKNVSAGFCALV